MFSINLQTRLLRSNYSSSPIKPTISQRTASVQRINRALGQAATLPANANVGRYAAYQFTNTQPVVYAVPGTQQIVS